MIIDLLQKNRKVLLTKLSFITCLTMLVGLFASRALLSIGIMSFFATALLNENLKSNLTFFFKKPLGYSLLIYVVWLGISFFWSQNQTYYLNRMQIILPFLILPFSIYSTKDWTKIQFQHIIYCFIILVFLGMGWSLIQYLGDKEFYDNGYAYSKVIPTPFKNDHIRFSLAVVSAICFAVYLAYRQMNNVLKILLVTFSIFGILYLHILAAKTGLLAIYLIAFIFIFRLLFYTKNKKIALGLMVVFVTLPILMYQFSNSFRTKVHYVRYSYYEMKNDISQPNVSDEGRIISYKYALEILSKNTLVGVGLGDVYDEMNLRFKRDFPAANQEILLPHNQFLMTGVAIGFLGMLYLFVAQMMQLWWNRKKGFLVFIIWILLSLAMMIEPLFETQYGAFLYLFLTFFTLIWQEKETELA